MAQIIAEVSRTFNEFLLLPNRTRTDCSVGAVDLSTPLVRHRVGESPAITLRAPFTSAIMQAVSSPELAIALARDGGLSFLHHNQSIAEQAAAVRRVKNFKAGFVVSDTNVRPTDTLGHLLEVMRRTGHSTAAVTQDGSATGRLLGLVTSRDFHPQRHGLDGPVSGRMIPVAELQHASSDITLSAANARLWDERLDCLPVLDAEGNLQFLVFRSDYQDNKRFPHQLVDAGKRLRVGAGINTHDYRDRVPALVAAGADALCFDSSDGYSDWQAEALTWVKKHYPDVATGGGNVVDAEAFTFLAEAGADFVKVGVGGGSICITRDQKGIGRGQASAVLDVAAARDAFAARTGEYVPICSDGGLVHDYHMALALAMGSDFVMMGRYFARFDQAPGAKLPTRDGFVKEYWGEGSNRARNWQRYGQGGQGLVFEEGVDGYVPYAGDLHEGLAVTMTKIKSTMVSCGSLTLPEFQASARLTLVSEQSFQESHANVAVRETAPTTG
ncbi:inosine 5-monophosphate dehydrogenase [Longispora fulva]|uniref:IMP dehydrogenase n=1 Tax=Longispora fulva TaxID=619741 RepID=A0A8J7GTS1_9ACTN|nr:IMP dehydrogenase [Longispora fulva]MBG6137086.1 IMP dehydrogenase [Longispora fulva]GIG61560.1 inosine 5-monophosphate dehydrogenase [Longispora fulva]